MSLLSKELELKSEHEKVFHVENVTTNQKPQINGASNFSQSNCRPPKMANKCRWKTVYKWTYFHSIWVVSKYICGRRREMNKKSNGLKCME